MTNSALPPIPSCSGSFWERLPQPIVGLAPMDGVTDSAFRQIVAVYGKPDIVFTEFTNVHDICSGRLKALDSLRYSEEQRPVIAQIYGKDPTLFYQAAQVVCELGFDGLDINMGCPSKNVASSGSGAGLIRTPELALELMAMAKKGVQDWAEGQTLHQLGLKPSALETITLLRSEHGTLGQDGKRTPIPLSVKTRLGYDNIIIQEWSDCLIQGGPEAIAIHGRTLSQMYRGESDWDAIGLAAQRIQERGIVALGNGDIKTLQEAHHRIQETGVTGVLIGRGALGNPWIFRDIPHLRRTATDRNPVSLHTYIPTLEEKFRTMMQHAQAFEAIHGQERFVRMRKHLGWYCSSFPHAAALRAQMVRTNNSQDVWEILQTYLATHTAGEEVSTVSLSS